MVQESEVMKIGDKYYLNTDIQKVFEGRIPSIPEEEIEFDIDFQII